MKRFCAILAALCLLLACVPAGALPKNEQVGMDVGGFSSVDLTGGSIDGGAFSEHSVSVVCYFAAWSPECLAQLAILQQIHEENPAYGVYGLLKADATSTPEVVLGIMQEEGYTFTVFLCDDIWQDVVSLSVFIPQHFIVNTSGTIVEVWHAAFQSADRLRERLALWAGTVSPDGDADLDGITNVTDALFVMRCAMGLLIPEPENILHGDMNGSGALDIDDALRILRYAMGLGKGDNL